MKAGRTNYVYEFTYSSGPGRQEVFQCKYVDPEEALKRFMRILSLTKEPFDFKIVVRDEATKEESSYQVMGSVDDMLEKFRVFLETTTGETLAGVEANIGETEIIHSDVESMSTFEKMQTIIYASFKHGKFSSLDVVEIFKNTFGEELPKSTASTYLARMWNRGKGHLERFGNRSGYMYRLRTELPEVQKATEQAERLLATLELRVKK
ncbi:MAG TPA: hypothetical protein ENG31_03095 [Candidatus Thorarchaeota archaeon]|nr:MAG: hypothetical protein DRO73_01185 [Candidatus Thorarchaeota archaeon]HDD67588.1 hypothetical protein [Candidatus Thorarchaeota archaeon]